MEGLIRYLKECAIESLKEEMRQALIYLSSINAYANAAACGYWFNCCFWSSFYWVVT
ncbi:hypothetical protein A33I_17255 [Alkalihalophilus marmarensis DSM 21297]|uniref:Uncharacterized protein n=1 Tax=Alkalihalophilus marmarensis DSM 21297 TaxID=1188261 RepID=U6SMV6_9BACI|nr:hypothetical protein A33I_17255 [Alkalihalophilus marmarensis DSM 21297]